MSPFETFIGEVEISITDSVDSLDDEAAARLYAEVLDVEQRLDALRDALTLLAAKPHGAPTRRSVERGHRLGHGGQAGLQPVDLSLEAGRFIAVVRDLRPFLALDGVDQLQLEAADRVPDEILVERVHRQRCTRRGG